MQIGKYTLNLPKFDFSESSLVEMSVYSFVATVFLLALSVLTSLLNALDGLIRWATVGTFALSLCFLVLYLAKRTVDTYKEKQKPVEGTVDAKPTTETPASEAVVAQENKQVEPENNNDDQAPVDQPSQV